MLKKKHILPFPDKKRIIVSILILVFLFLNGGKELFHNHEHDLDRHDNCPVKIIDQVLSSGITIQFDICREQKETVTNFNLPELVFANTQISFFYLRAPPLV